MRPQNTAFTLVELLVVVAIIVILMAILLPSLQKAMDVAQAAKCGTNLHAMGRANHMYGEDHARMFPGGGFGMQRPPISSGYDFLASSHSWHTDANGETGIRKVEGNANYPGGHLWPYTNVEAMFICPTFVGLFSQPTPQAHLAGHGQIERSPGMSYSMNNAIWDDADSDGVYLKLSRQSGPWDETDPSTTQTTMLYRPSDTMIYCEENMELNASGGAKDDTLMLTHRKQFPRPPWDNCIGDFHVPGSGPNGAGKSNVLFGDGHVFMHTSSESADLAYPGMVIR